MKRRRLSTESTQRVRQRTTAIQISLLAWECEDGLVLHMLSFLNVTKLVEKKQVCKKWQRLCTSAIDNKCKHPKNFQSTVELGRIAGKYCGNCPEDMEEIARLYGYPINKWKVHLVEDFFGVFLGCVNFNEYIGDWDMSNARSLEAMFLEARSFNQDLSKWSTSNVTTMRLLFASASSFNQSLNSWDTSNVTDIFGVLCEASAFNQPMNAWDTRKITDMCSAFAKATLFNQSLSNWNFENVEDYGGMLFEASSFTFYQDLPDGLDTDVLLDWE